MRPAFFLLLTLPLDAQSLRVPCEPSPETVKLLEAVPPLHDESIPYEQRIGALYTLAKKYPGDFFIQRAYQDSFRQRYFLADEFDRAMALYHRFRADPLSSYYKARLLMHAQPEESGAVFERLLKQFPQFVWPRLEFVEWNTMPGRRRTDDAALHLKSFQTGCPVRQKNSWVDSGSGNLPSE